MSRITTCVITAGNESQHVQKTIEALGSIEGDKYLLSNGPLNYTPPKDWIKLELNQNYGIGVLINLATRLSSEFLLLLEDDWILHNAPHDWVGRAIAVMESHELDVLRFRRHLGVKDARRYSIDDWISSVELEQNQFEERKLLLREGGNWLMQNTPHIRRTSSFQNLVPFIEHDGEVYRDAWLRYDYPKEEVAINEFNTRIDTQKLRIGVLHPGLFVHEMFEPAQCLPLKCTNCAFGFLRGYEESNLNWCTTCDQKLQNFIPADWRFYCAVKDVSEIIETITRTPCNPAWKPIRVLAFGLTPDVVEVLPFTAKLADYADWRAEVANFQPDVILTYGENGYSPDMELMEVAWRIRWVHADQPSKLIPSVINCYNHSLYRPPLAPLVSVYTGAHLTGEMITDAFNSLQRQTYTNWEWIVVVDTPHEPTESRLAVAAAQDARVKVHRIPYTGRVGAVKDTATRLCRGEYVVELDHDDILLPTALAEVVKVFSQDSSVGFVYSDCAEVDIITGKCLTYDQGEGDDVEFWKTRYRTEIFDGKEYRVVSTPNIYDSWGPEHDKQAAWFLTLSPNHLRAYRRNVLVALGGYNSNLPVADDWDVMIRFFMHSSCVHIPKFLYIQRYSGQNTQDRAGWRELIQYCLQQARNYYELEFKATLIKRQWSAPAFPEALLTIVIPTWIQQPRDAIRLSSLLNEIQQAAEQGSASKISVKLISDGYNPQGFEQVKSMFEQVSEHLDIQALFVPPQPKPAWGHAQRAWALEEAKTRYVWFVDDDNQLYPDSLLPIIQQLEQKCPDLLLVNLDYDGNHAGLPHLDKLDIQRAEDVRFQHIDTMSFIVKKGLASWADMNYTGDWSFIKSCMMKAQKIVYSRILAGKYFRG